VKLAVAIIVMTMASSVVSGCGSSSTAPPPPVAPTCPIGTGDWVGFAQFGQFAYDGADLFLTIGQSAGGQLAGSGTYTWRTSNPTAQPVRVTGTLSGRTVTLVITKYGTTTTASFTGSFQTDSTVAGSATGFFTSSQVSFTLRLDGYNPCLAK